MISLLRQTSLTKDYEVLKSENTELEQNNEKLIKDVETLKEENDTLKQENSVEQTSDNSSNTSDGDSDVETTSISTESANNTTEVASESSGECNIKGSVNGIYHTPGSTYYDRTTNVVEWFCTPEEAVDAGYRAPKR